MYLHRLRDLREDRDLTQQEIADLLGIKREVYRRYETGIRDLPLWALVRLSVFYQCSCDYPPVTIFWSSPTERNGRKSCTGSTIKECLSIKNRPEEIMISFRSVF